MRPERLRRRAAAVLAATVLAALPSLTTPGQAHAQAPDLAVATSAPLRPGDALRLSFWREPAINGDFPVDETGSVALPYLGYRDVGGVSAAELKRRLSEEYAQFLSNQVVQVIVLRRVTVAGAVREPGLYHVDPTMTLRETLALAGGLTPEARREVVILRRGDAEIRVEGADAAAVGEGLRSGDQLYVPERGWLARNSGPVLGALISALGFIVGQAVF